MMPTSASERSEGAVTAEARHLAFRVLRGAWRKRSASGLTAAELAKRLDRGKPQVSRVLNGHSPAMTLDTLALFLDRLGFKLILQAKEFEEIPSGNRDVRPYPEPITQSVQLRNFPANKAASTSGKVLIIR